MSCRLLLLVLVAGHGTCSAAMPESPRVDTAENSEDVNRTETYNAHVPPDDPRFLYEGRWLNPLASQTTVTTEIGQTAKPDGTPSATASYARAARSSMLPFLAEAFFNRAFRSDWVCSTVYFQVSVRTPSSSKGSGPRFFSLGRQLSRLRSTKLTRTTTTAAASRKPSTEPSTKAVPVEVQASSSTNSTLCQATVGRVFCCHSPAVDENIDGPPESGDGDNHEGDGTGTCSRDTEPVDNDRLDRAEGVRTTKRRAHLRRIKVRWHGLRTRVRLNVHDVSGGQVDVSSRHKS
mmetsp:Transcript_7443/g.27326  ORF Transcript_7443/g.27326 Transcript_7443/m.27326 type:complete len:291 (-) Transcript_7443:3519-4391(-)